MSETIWLDFAIPVISIIIGVTKTPGSWSDFWARIQESYKEVNNV